MRYKHKWTYWFWAVFYAAIAVAWVFADKSLNFFGYIAPFAFGACAVREIYWFYKDSHHAK